MATQDFSRSLPMMLYRALDAVLPRFRRIFNEFGLTEQQWRVLRVLWEHDAVAFGALSAATLIPAPSLVGIVDRLANQGLVARQRSKTDRRNVFVRATEEGRELHRQVQPRVDAAYAELRASIDARAWQQLMTGLERIAALEAGMADERPAVNQ